MILKLIILISMKIGIKSGKSLYHCKYHIKNILNQINEKHDTEIGCQKKQKIDLNYLIKCYHKLMKAQKLNN